jgi:hypothetical protein
MARDSGAKNKASATAIASLNGKSFTEASYSRNVSLASFRPRTARLLERVVDFEEALEKWREAVVAVLQDTVAAS